MSSRQKSNSVVSHRALLLEWAGTLRDEDTRRAAAASDREKTDVLNLAELKHLAQVLSEYEAGGEDYKLVFAKNKPASPRNPHGRGME